MNRSEKLKVIAHRLFEKYGDQLEMISDKFQEQHDKFMSATEGENYFQIILRAHLYIEFEMTEILNAKLAHPKELGDKLSFNTMLKLLLAIGAIPLELKSPINFLNKIRNKYAHELDFEFSEEMFKKFIDTFAEDFDKSFKKYKNISNYDSLSAELKHVLASLWLVLIGHRLINEEVAIELENFHKEIEGI